MNERLKNKKTNELKSKGLGFKIAFDLSEWPAPGT